MHLNLSYKPDIEGKLREKTKDVCVIEKRMNYVASNDIGYN
jgi:hypothetical protein